LYARAQSSFQLSLGYVTQQSRSFSVTGTEQSMLIAIAESTKSEINRSKQALGYLEIFP